MGRDARDHVDYVVGPEGYRLTLQNLPPANTSRWVSRRKAEVVIAVRDGLISLADACVRYRLSVEEFASWQKAMERDGMDGLRATRPSKTNDSRKPSAFQAERISAQAETRSL